MTGRTIDRLVDVYDDRFHDLCATEVWLGAEVHVVGIVPGGCTYVVAPAEGDPYPGEHVSWAEALAWILQRCPDCDGAGRVEVGQHSHGTPIEAPCETCAPREYGRWEQRSERAGAAW